MFNSFEMSAQVWEELTLGCRLLAEVSASSFGCCSTWREGAAQPRGSSGPASPGRGGKTWCFLGVSDRCPWGLCVSFPGAGRGGVAPPRKGLLRECEVPSTRHRAWPGLPSPREGELGAEMPFPSLGLMLRFPFGPGADGTHGCSAAGLDPAPWGKCWPQAWLLSPGLRSPTCNTISFMLWAWPGMVWVLAPWVLTPWCWGVPGVLQPPGELGQGLRERRRKAGGGMGW